MRRHRGGLGAPAAEQPHTSSSSTLLEICPGETSSPSMRLPRRERPPSHLLSASLSKLLGNGGGTSAPVTGVCGSLVAPQSTPAARRAAARTVRSSAACGHAAREHQRRSHALLTRLTGQTPVAGAAGRSVSGAPAMRHPPMLRAKRTATSPSSVIVAGRTPRRTKHVCVAVRACAACARTHLAQLIERDHCRWVLLHPVAEGVLWKRAFLLDSCQQRRHCRTREIGRHTAART